MKKIITTILIVILLVCIWNPSSGVVKVAANGWWDPDWGYRKVITIDYDMVDVDLTNFPILFHNTSSDFTDHAQSDGDDFVFISSDGITQYNHEIEYYDSITGELIAWVNITSLNSTVDTILYLYYGNSTCGSQENIAGTWDSNYLMVQHMDGASATALDDSTSNDNDVVSDGGNPIYNADGKIGKCVDFDGDDYLDVPDSDSLDIDNEITITAWLYESNTATEEVWLVKDDGTGTNYQCELYDGVAGDNKLLIQVDRTWTVGNTETVNNNWYYYGVVYDELNTYYYLNGAADGSPAMSEDMGAQINNANLRIGAFTNGMLGIEDRVDEIQISNILRSSSWISTSYNTMNSPSTFLSVGSEQSQGGNFPPTVEILYPKEGQTVAGIITIGGTADDYEGIVEYVQVKIDDENWGNASGTTTWSYKWDTTQYLDGDHIIYARSYDGENYSIYDVVHIIVDNSDNIAPYLKIETPHWGCIYFVLDGVPYAYIPAIPIITIIIGSIYVVANVSDNVGIESVEFYVDNVLKGIATDPEPAFPDFYVWLWGGRSPLFQFNLKVVARDLSGNEATDSIKVWRIQVFP